ncbi:c-type cytochrome biogenesis protein CcmI [Acuticoccus sp. I52.16.1]|uniref:c-type cytochrome biogenesis protein CcmI n=1 Tax=Acuticoccus sp. I52.16.1 TaxID=2928472 RepID=UPI001FD03768|nr:c-type cytochrome biogenesis protein CcmI [Acuticoccus sp. I52.16.1]UOM34247.1 c-type cytochrome biogenesis protein CcmI [Acuticoccus sp. I52.16.1]
MVLWIVFAGLAVSTLALVCRPLLASGAPAMGGSDEVVYAAQLEEIEADCTRGTIGEEEAKAARTEVARRLLRAHREGGDTARSGRRRWGAAALLAVLVPAAAVGAYLTLGMPGYGDRPLAARQTTNESDFAQLVARAEARLAARPDEGAGWEALAPMYLRMRRFADAADAYARAAELLGPSPARLTGRGQALMFAAGGTVTDAALELFRQASAAEPEAVAPRVFLAVAARQRGDLSDAAARWRTLLEASDGSESWLPIARSEVAALKQADAAARTPQAAARGPSAAAPTAAAPAVAAPPAAAAIAALPAGERAAQIEGMVASLAARLETDGGTAEEWARLVRSYRVMGREADAETAVAAALAALDGPEREAFAATVDGAVDPVSGPR